MKKLTDKEVKQIELDILEYVHNFCEENGLKYIMTTAHLLVLFVIRDLFHGMMMLIY